MPKRTAAPFIIRPPADFVAARPALQFAANDVARVYAGHEQGKFLTDKGLQAIGEGLWTALVAADPALPERFETDRAAAGLRILPIVVESDEAAVQKLPWEALYHPTHGFLGRAPAFTLSRRTPGPAAGAEDPERGPLRIVMFTCLPDDLDAEKERLDVEEQQALALQAWGADIAAGRVQLKMPDDGRFRTFQQLIDDFEPHVVFLFTHGKFHQPLKHEADRTPRAIVLFETEDGRSDPVDAATLAAVFPGSAVRCLVLSACETGMTSSDNLAAGLAWKLNEAGLPHVIAMRESILATAGMQFNRAFGEAIVRRERVDVALQTARAAIATPLANHAGISAADAEQSLGQWALPALVSRDVSRDVSQQLIDWDFAPQPPARTITTGELGKLTLDLPPRFIGRRSELRAHKGPLLRGDRPQLLITGPGGQGKTVLASKIAQDWSAPGGELLAWTARPGSGIPWDQFLLELELTLDAGRRELYNRRAGHLTTDQERAGLLLRLLLDQFGGRLLVFLDNLEDVQDPATLALTDDRLAAFIAAARELGPDGLRLLLTSRVRLPDWPDDAGHLLLPRSSYGDFLQMALAENAGAAVWQPGRPRRLYDALHGNGRGLRWFAGAAQHMDPAAEDAFLDQLAATSDRLREDMALTTLIGGLDAAARALLDRLPAYHVPVPVEGILTLALDLPGAAEALDRLLAVSLVDRYRDPEWQTLVYGVSPLVAGWLARQDGYALDPVWLRSAAEYQHYLYRHELYSTRLRKVSQAAVVHHALRRMGDRAAANRWTLDEIVGPLQREGLYRTLLDVWLPPLGESQDAAIRARGLGHTGLNHDYLGEYNLALNYHEQSLAIRQAIGNRTSKGPRSITSPKSTAPAATMRRRWPICSSRWPSARRSATVRRRDHAQ